MNPASELKKLILRQPRLTLAVAESLTCGHVQAAIGSVSGASEYFLGGVTAYSLAQKVKLLGVDRAHARSVNCVSQRVAVEMARGACDRFGADLAVATTGYAEPNRAEGVKAPLAWWALCHRRRGGRATIISGLLEVPGATRVQAQERVTAEVLRQLVAYLREFRRGEENIARARLPALQPGLPAVGLAKAGATAISPWNRATKNPPECGGFCRKDFRAYCVRRVT